MSHGIYTAGAGAMARQNQLDVVAHNIANASSNGFRRVLLSFQEADTQATSDARHMVVVNGETISTEVGSYKSTDNPLDLALHGDGFFRTEDFDGEVSLVRTFPGRVNSYGELVDLQNRKMLGRDGGSIYLEPGVPVYVTDEGQVLQHDQVVADLAIVNVPDPARLRPVANGAYRVTAGSGEGFSMAGTVLSGTLEGSNVNMVESMIQLLSLQRDYQSLTKAISAYREADERLIRAAGDLG
jgi:flagellar basal body rod protein FlgG